MKQITANIHDKEGLHARPAGVLCKVAKGFESKVTIAKGEKSADMKRVFGIMGLVVKCGDEITISIEGPDEDAALAALTEALKAV